MRRRSLLLFAGALLLSFADLTLRGRGTVSVLFTNLLVPPVSSNIRDRDLVHPTPATGRAYDLTLGPPPSAPAGAHLELQLASSGRTRILAVRPGHPMPSRARAALDVLRGRAALRIVTDRGWLDLGPLPAGPLEVQVLGFLPGPFGFTELNETPKEARPSVLIVRSEAPGDLVLKTALRWRIIETQPVAAVEGLARFFFFFGAGPVLLLSGLTALALLVTGSVLLARERVPLAVCCLVSSATLFHAACLPPFQGADETSHAATIEALIFRGTVPRAEDPYPRSFTLVAEALQQDRVQHRPGEPLPIGSEAARQTLRRLLQSGLRPQARERGIEAPAAALQPADRRAALFFRAFRPVGPFLRSLSVLDRISAYRLISALWGLALFCAGALGMSRLGSTDQMVLLYGIVALLPYSVATVASCSNYAPAIGLGQLLAATALVAVLTDEPRVRVRAALLFVVGSGIGALLWTDFIFVAVLGALICFCGGGSRLLRRAGLSNVAAWTLSSLTGLTLVVLASFPLVRFLWSHALGEQTRSVLESQLPTTLALMAAAVLTPLIVAAALALFAIRLSKESVTDARSILQGVSGTFGAVLLAGFLLVRWTEVPYENVRLSFPRLVEVHLKAFLSNNFAFDQDRLSWKFYWGAFGWHDAFYPDWIYAAARWGCVALLVSVPMLAAIFLARKPRAAAALLLASGAALSCCVVSETLRYLAPGNPFGRFILPLVPLAVLPILVMMEAPGRDRFLRVALVAGVALQIWTAVAVLGGRYCFGN